MMMKVLRIGILGLVLICLCPGCSVAPVSLGEYPVRGTKDRALILIEASGYKFGLADALANRLNRLGISVSIDDVLKSSNYHADDYGAVLLIVSLKQGIIIPDAMKFLEENSGADNLVLYVTKGKKFMQLPREIVSRSEIDTVSSASIAHPQGDMLDHLEVMLRKRLRM